MLYNIKFLFVRYWDHGIIISFSRDCSWNSRTPYHFSAKCCWLTLFPVCPAENVVIIIISVSSDITLSTFDEGKKKQTAVPLHSCWRSVQPLQLSGSINEKPGSVKLYLNPVFKKSRKYENVLLLGCLLKTTCVIQGWVDGFTFGSDNKNIFFLIIFVVVVYLVVLFICLFVLSKCNQPYSIEENVLGRCRTLGLQLKQFCLAMVCLHDL